MWLILTYFKLKFGPQTHTLAHTHSVQREGGDTNLIWRSHWAAGLFESCYPVRAGSHWLRSLSGLHKSRTLVHLGPDWAELALDVGFFLSHMKHKSQLNPSHVFRSVNHRVGCRSAGWTLNTDFFFFFFYDAVLLEVIQRSLFIFYVVSPQYAVFDVCQTSESLKKSSITVTGPECPADVALHHRISSEAFLTMFFYYQIGFLKEIL